MKLYVKNEVTLSEDTTQPPRQVRFSAIDEISEITAIQDGEGSTKTYDVGTHVIDMASITLGKFVYLKGESDFTAVIGGSNISIVGGKASVLWANFSTLSLVVAGSPSRITVAVGGA